MKPRILEFIKNNPDTWEASPWKPKRCIGVGDGDGEKDTVSNNDKRVC